MQFEEKDISDWLRSLSAPERKSSAGADGLKIVLWALQPEVHSVTSDFNVMVPPNGISGSQVLPSGALLDRRD
jgi:hypothetical protein